MTSAWNHPARPYVAPFAAFLLLLAVGPRLPLAAFEQPLRVVLLAGILWLCSRGAIRLRPALPWTSVLVGAAVFVLWVTPDSLWPGYRDHWLFQNRVLGELKPSFPENLRGDWMALAFRSLRAVILVPIIEELFWRAWLMRWLIRGDFDSVPLGAYDRRAFWLTALLFASEHGPYWDVGLLAGAAYNAWMIRTRSLADCILAHAVTNALLSAYVIWGGKWEYWM